MTGLKCEFSLLEVIGLVIIWALISIVTLGLGLIVMPYYVLRAPLNRTYLVNQDGFKVARLFVDFNLGESILHAIIWFILSIVTFGLAYFFYWFAVYRKLLNNSILHEI